MEKEEALKILREDYVSFEIAKLLKEKGFDESIETLIGPEEIIYHLDENSISRQIHSTISNSEINIYSENVSCPTTQMAMKWLRKVHKLYVNVCPSVEGYYWTEKWHSYVENLEKRYPFGRFIGTFNSHEKACEAAIKYCLENLI